MRRVLLSCVLGLIATAACGVTLDFSRPGSLVVGRGRFVARADGQVVFGADGATVHLDPSRTKADEPTYYSLRPQLPAAVDWTDKRVVLTVRFGERPAVRKSLSLDFVDAEGEVFRFKPVRIVRDGGLSRLEYEIRAEATSLPSWGKRRNGRFDGAVRLVELLGSYATDAPGSIVYVSLCGQAVEPSVCTVDAYVDVPTDRTYPGPRPLPPGAERLSADALATLGFTQGVARVRTTAVGALAFDVDTGDPLHLLRGRKGPVTLVFRNLSRERRHWRGHVRFSGFFGETVEQAVDVTAGGGETVRVAAQPVPAQGLWLVTAELVGDDARRGTAHARFAAVDRHEATPFLPKPHFRMGINFHAQHYVGSDCHFARTLDALTASGAKLVRVGGFKFCDNVPKAGAPDWTRCDAIFRALRARGFALNANLYPGPAWARKPMPPEMARTKLPHKSNWPTREGLFRDYCTAFATRYGDGIDYFEIGNEWDLTSAKILPPDEAFRLMDEGYAGVKAGCPTGTVITCGWTSGATGPMTAQANPGLAEAFHAKAPYDVWPLHVHGPFETYRKELQTKFFPLRERVGRGKPWYSNETAMSTAGCAEEEAAQTVWKKILYAWTWGSTDYIWYNLRATDWRDGDGEGGFGLMTADYRPRATFAAFAALATLVTGAERPERLEEDETRFVCRFRLPNGGGTALAGWDTSSSPRAVRVDAVRAELVDLMGNRSPLAANGGSVTWTPGVNPSALIVGPAGEQPR